MRNFFSILFLCIAGFFVYMLGMLSFMSIGSAKYFVLIFLLLPTVVLAGLGAALHTQKGWEKSVGLVFLCGFLFSACVVLMAVCISAEPILRDQFGVGILSLLGDYIAGTVINLLFLITGLGLLHAAHRRSGASDVVDAHAHAQS